MILLKNCSLYNPGFLGRNDVLMGGGRVLHIEKDIILNIVDVERIDVKGNMVIPGIIDSHIHIAGAGGEGGPSSRTPEMNLESIVGSGITSVVGCLGTDGLTRSVESVLMKAKAFRQAGVSAWIYTGSYQVPPPTITGNISKDLLLINEVIGVGEIALGDHRSSLPGKLEFARLVQMSKLGGMLGNKAGVVNIHLGDQGDPFGFINEIIDEYEISPSTLIPTHCNRSRKVFEKAKEYSLKGHVDLTTSSYEFYKDIEVKPSQAYHELINNGTDPERITLSSDSGGSLPVFNKKNEIIRSASGNPLSLFKEVKDIFGNSPANSGLITEALKTVSSNISKKLKLESKGEIKQGNDADIIILDNEMNINSVIINGVFKIKDKEFVNKENIS